MSLHSKPWPNLISSVSSTNLNSLTFLQGDVGFQGHQGPPGPPGHGEPGSLVRTVPRNVDNTHWRSWTHHFFWSALFLIRDLKDHRESKERGDQQEKVCLDQRSVQRAKGLTNYRKSIVVIGHSKESRRPTETAVIIVEHRTGLYGTEEPNSSHHLYIFRRQTAVGQTQGRGDHRLR